jgi:hypothetical protein
MHKVPTANAVIGPSRVEPQVSGRAPAQFLDSSDLRLPAPCDGMLTVNPDFNAA